MEQVIGRHAQNWRGPTKPRKELNLYFGWMFYINGFGASMWMIEAAWLQYNNTFFVPHCYGRDMNEEVSISSMFYEQLLPAFAHIDPKSVKIY